MDLDRFTKLAVRFQSETELKKLLSAIGLGEAFYLVGLTAVTAGAAQISTAAGWITCGTILLATSVYSYVRK